MIYDKRTKINDFPVGSNGSEKFDLVYIATELPYYCLISEQLYTEYVFLITTKVYHGVSSKTYGHVNIDLIRHDKLSYFNDIFQRRGGNFYTLKESPLIINEFITISPIITEQNIQIIATLKNQKILCNDGTVSMSKNFNVYLLGGSGFDNRPKLELAPEFQLQIEIDELTQNLNRLKDYLYKFEDFFSKNEAVLTNEFETIKGIIEKEIKEVELLQRQAIERQFKLKRALQYINKMSNSC